MLRFVVGMMLAFSVAVTSAQDALDLEIPGKIAFIGDDRNVYLFNPATGDKTALTKDAAISDATFRYYTWPTWSTDGRLAYFSLENTAAGDVTTQAFASDDGTTPGEVVYTGDGEVFNYAAWAPGNCNDSENCRALSMLLNSAAEGGLFVNIVKDSVDGNPSTVIGRGGPFYYSWSPDGDQMVWQRNNQRLDVYSVDDSEIQMELTQRPGVFQAPDWSPIDDRLLVGEFDADAQKTDLVVVTSQDATTLVEDLDGVLAFAWSPDGESIAYVDGAGPLVVIDSQTGDVISRTLNGGVGAFFWSPDSAHIAYITLATPPDSATASSGLTAAPVYQETQLAWSILDAQSGDVNRYGAFTPTQEMVYMFTYFDQFAQSHRVWSPDSRYIVYSELVDEEPVVNILDTQLDDTVPMSIADGTLAIWSYD